MQDVTFHSASLNRDMQYRVVLPSVLPDKQKLPVVYLLHGLGEHYQEWSNNSDVAKFAESGLILVMPEGRASFYINGVNPEDRFEDYIVKDLIADVESKFPVAKERGRRAVVGVSMGGYGAVKLALIHPELFVFAGALSPAVDAPTRPFSIRGWKRWRQHRAAFGPWNGELQHKNDPFLLAPTSDPNKVPYLFLTCGEQDSLLPTNRRFSSLLGQLHFQFEYDFGPGSHDWNEWNSRLPKLFESLNEHLDKSQ